MIRFLKNRILPVMLALSVCLSLLVVPAKAASAVGSQIAAGNTTLTEATGDYPAFFNGVLAYIERSEFGQSTTPYSSGVSLYSRITEKAFVFDVGSVENLYNYASAINTNDVGLKCMVSQTGSGPNDYYYIQYISVNRYSGAGFDRNSYHEKLALKYTAADENGLILVASVAAAGDVEGKWVTYNKSLPQDTTDYESLIDMKNGLQAHGVNCSVTQMDVGYVLTRSVGTPPYYVTEVYANAWGGMYVAPTDNRVLIDDRTHIDGDGNNVNVGLDFTGGTFSLGDGSSFDLSQLIYDEGTKTYYVDTYQENVEGDTYVTYNFSFSFHIDHTSITYIGQTEEYNKYYEYYYELPDGRSSADLTAEELEQLNVSMDVLPYIRSTDDVHVRALYHFDGDTTDSSYWNHLSSFEWTTGASITYMDAGVFEGALYLDEQAHRFVITLPKNLASSDFTIQWRMYQSATAAPVNDTTFGIAGSNLLTTDGANWCDKTNENAVIAKIPIGTWCEYAIVRSSSGIHFFINGLKVHSWGSSYASKSYTNKLIFNFGDQQQTYKYFDELRVVTKALYGTEGYTPTAVPHDTNLALVLPDSKLPVADAYWSFESSKTNLLKEYGLSDWVNVADGDKANLEQVSNTSNSYFTSYYNSSNPSGVRYSVQPFLSEAFSNVNHRDAAFPYMHYESNVTVFHSDFGSSFSVAPMNSTEHYTSPNYSVVTATDDTINFSVDHLMYYPTGGLITTFPLVTRDTADAVFPDALEAGKTYTLSMVDGEGQVGSFTFTMPELVESTYSGYSLKNLEILPSSLTPITESKYLSTVDVNGGTTTYKSWGYNSFAFVGEYLFNDYYFIVYPAAHNETSSSTKATEYYPLYVLQIVPVVSDETLNSSTGYYDGGEFVYLELVEGETDLKAEYVESIAVMDKDDINTPSLAVKTDLDITGHQIGGMRPSVPEKGLVWALVEGGIIKSLQIYNGSAWEAVDGRIWTGSRWVPYSAYNVLLMKDLYDITGTVAPDDYEYIYTEQGFWSWWQKSWLDFVSWIKGDSGGEGESDSSDQTDDSVIPPVTDEDDGSEWKFLDLLVLLKDGAWAVGKGIVVTVFDGISGLATAVDGVGGFFDSYSSGGSVFQIYEEGEGIWD